MPSAFVAGYLFIYQGVLSVVFNGIVLKEEVKIPFFEKSSGVRPLSLDGKIEYSFKLSHEWFLHFRKIDFDEILLTRLLVRRTDVYFKSEYI